MGTTKTAPNGNVLGRMILQRLIQLGISRRQFCMSIGISRQTLYEIEHQGKVNLQPATAQAIDEGLHWQPGTTLAIANGESISRPDLAERIDGYMKRILERLSLMTVDELERESIWLEQELFGRTATDMDESIKLIREAMKRIIPSFEQGNNPTSGERAK